MIEFWRFQSIPNDSYVEIVGEYNYFIVVLSFCISSLAAYALLVVLERAWQAKTNKTLHIWKACGSIVFGLGVWAMHFTGMLAFTLPLSMSYSSSLTTLSIFTPMVGTYICLYFLVKQNFSIVSIQVSALSLACGIGSMHFIGMEAMNTDAMMIYDIRLFLLSILVAHILATVSIYLIKVFNQDSKLFLGNKSLTAFVMGAAVACMHYVAMAAVHFEVLKDATISHHDMGETAVTLSLAIAGIVFIIVATTIICALVEAKLIKAELSVEESSNRAKEIVEQMADGLLTMDSSGKILSMNSSGLAMFAYELDEVIGNSLSLIMADKRFDHLGSCSLDEILKQESKNTFETFGKKKNQDKFPIEVNFSKMSFKTHDQHQYNCVARDITERSLLETQLRQAQKLESIGQLSAGIAHEINTPIQYVTDNISFLDEAFGKMLKILNLVKILKDTDDKHRLERGMEELKVLFQDKDIDFFLDEVPHAITQSTEGLSRVRNIIGAMKSFSHSNQGKMISIDVKEAILSTITVCRNEWRYIANLTTDFEQNLPPLVCLRDELNQVILNFIVNAAHAIEEKLGSASGNKGNIHISVSQTEDHFKITVKDDGTGMTDSVKERIYDPFFTTKQVGKGTGQGLNIAYSVVVEKHKGSILLDTKVGEGTLFTIILPKKPQ